MKSPAPINGAGSLSLRRQCEISFSSIGVVEALEPVANFRLDEILVVGDGEEPTDQEHPRSTTFVAQAGNVATEALRHAGAFELTCELNVDGDVRVMGIAKCVDDAIRTRPIRNDKLRGGHTTHPFCWLISQRVIPISFPINHLAYTRNSPKGLNDIIPKNG